MKKIISMLLALVLCLTLCACSKEDNGNSDSELNAETQSAPLSAKEQLIEEELQLFEALIKMVTKDFYEPSAVRVLDIKDYVKKTDNDKNDLMYGPDTVVVQLQGENRLGGTLNHYYRVCIVAAENMSESGQSMIKSHLILNDMEGLLDYKGEVGDYVELPDNYDFLEDDSDSFRIVYGADDFDVGRVNKALKEYWEDMGF